MIPSIPKDVVTEIFSWLPVKSLLRFKCVTKFFNSLVSESDFTDFHRCRSMTRPGGTKLFWHGREFYYTAEQKEDVKASFSLLQIESFDQLPVYSSLNCANGLFLIWEPLSMQPAAILNPSTREVRFLPKINEDFSLYNYSLGFEPEENKYKVLSTTNNVQEQHRKHQVLSLGTDKSWRDTKNSPPILCKPGVCINGVIYKFVRHDKLAIAAFDVKTENFKFITLWNNAYLSRYYELIEVNGQLAVIEYETQPGYIHLWVLEQEEWESHTIQFPSILKSIQPHSISPCTTGDGEIVVVLTFTSGNSLFWCYDVMRKRWRKLEIKALPKKSNIKGIYSYVERLVM